MSNETFEDTPVLRVTREMVDHIEEVLCSYQKGEFENDAVYAALYCMRNRIGQRIVDTRRMEGET